jgi:His-Xaa-Ser system radical SAM maturase HxsC
MSLIDLAGRLRPLTEGSHDPMIVRVTEDAEAAPSERSTLALLVRAPAATLPTGFAAYLCHCEPASAGEPNMFLLPNSLNYLTDGDIVRIDPSRRSLRTLYRRRSTSNSFLVTERCDNYCVMCSQPPKEAADGWLVDELLRVIPLVDPATRSLGITGGEPGLLGPRLIELLASMRKHLPNTAVHVLSNGRAFADLSFARQVASVGLPDLMIGIPLYSDLPEDHDYVVQARGAFDQTVRGVLNLKRVGVRVELRFVIHSKTVQRLPEFANFVARNLLFVDQVALMGLELMGFAKANLDALWIDPLDYTAELAKAVETLHRARAPVAIYNHQLCVLPTPLHRFARRSISDWKNWYPEECGSCSARDECGGFFASASIRRSRGIVPLSLRVASG